MQANERLGSDLRPLFCWRGQVRLMRLDQFMIMTASASRTGKV